MTSSASISSPARPARIPLKVHLWAVGAFVILCAVTAGLFLAYRDDNIWEGMRESSEFRKQAYAERVYPDSVFRTRVNTWSNLAYAFVGLYALALAVSDSRNRTGSRSTLARTPAMSVLYGTACVGLGIGSGVFHASLTRWGQQLDVAAMYAPVVALIALNAARIAPRIPVGIRGYPTWPVLSVLTVVSWGLLYVYKWSMSSGIVLPALIASAALLDLVAQVLHRSRMRWRLIVIAMGSLALSVLCRNLDIEGRFSGPDSLWQGHSFWHLFTALSLWCAYFYYRSEQPRGDTT